MENNQTNNDATSSASPQGIPQMQNDVNNVPVAPVPTISPEQPPQNKTSGWRKTLMIIGGVAVGVIIFIIILFVVVSATSKKLDCSSSQGNITLMYDDDTLNGYAANGVTYDLDGQQAIAERIGVEAYIDEFANWFESSSDGTCTKR